MEGASGSASPTSSARPAADVTAITVHDDFLLEIGEALSGQASVRPVDSVATALEHLSGARRAQVVMIDTRAVADLRADVERLQSEAPAASVLVFAPAENEKQTAASLKGTGVFAVLPLPVDVRKTAAVFDGALADANTRRAAQQATGRGSQDQRGDRSPSFTVETYSAGSEPSQTEPPSGSKLPLLAAVGVALVLVAGGAFWYFTRKDAGEASTQVRATIPESAVTDEQVVDDEALIGPAPVADLSVIDGSVDELLEKARLAMRERRYTEPTGNNALVYYRSALAAEPNNPEALDGLSRVANVLANRIEESVAEGRLDVAAQALANLRSAVPDDKRIGPLAERLLTAQVQQALDDDNVDRAAALVRQAQQQGVVPADKLAEWRAEVARRQESARLARLTDLFNERIRTGRLNEPAGDSAQRYLEQIREISPATATRLSRQLHTAYLREARAAGLAGRTSEMERWLTQARAAGVSTSDIAAVQREVTTARLRATSAEADRLAQLVRERIREGKLTAPDNDSAAHHLTALKATDANHSAIVPLSRELADQLLQRASMAARERRTAEVQADLAAARTWGASASEIQAVQQLAAQAVAASSRSQPPAAAAARPPIDPALLAERLKRIRYVPPEYPPRALQQRIAGQVVVEFVVGKDGETRDVRVESAEPAGVFDRAAISAVRRWRYEPVVIDGVPVEVPARTSIRFELPD